MTIYCTDIAPVIGANMMFGYQQYTLNQEATAKYYKIEGMTSGGGWTPQAAQQLGSLASGTGKRFNAVDLMQRTTPAAPITEDVTLRISRYPDATYMDPPEATDDRVVTHKLIDSDLMTLLEESNFDDGTVQGWSHTGGGINPYSGNGGISAEITYYLSSAYSLRAWRSGWSHGSNWVEAYKSFTIPAASEAYAIINVLLNNIDASYFDYFRIYEDSDIIAELNPDAHDITERKWLRFVVPMTPNGDRILHLHTSARYTCCTTKYAHVYFDDIKIVYA